MKHLSIIGYCESYLHYPTAMVDFDVGGYKVNHLVAVDSVASPCDVELGCNIGHALKQVRISTFHLACTQALIL